jgi:RNA polymerase sigma-70 factor (ECF subfamily)
MITDEALLLDFQRGSQAALSELFDRYRVPLFAFFCRRLLNRERAEDLTQETFLAIMRGRSRYEPRASVRTYLYGIALNLVFAERRKQSKTDRSVAGQASRVPGGNIELDVLVRDAIAQLDTSEREIIMLREYEQLSYGEISDVLKLPVNTVRTRLFRSRMALRKHLETPTTMRLIKEDDKCL